MIKYIKAVGGIIYKENSDGSRKILIIQRSKKDHWPLFYEFPRGKCDKRKDEKIIDCLRREIKEEIGIDIKIEKFLGKYYYIGDKGNKKTICYIFQCRMKNREDEIKLSEEHKDY